MPDALQQQENNRSAMFDKIPADFRHQVDVAIIERCPPTFQAVWTQFRLGERGVTFSSFYRYARRLRDRVNLAELADLCPTDDTAMENGLRKLLAQRLIEELLNKDCPDPRDIAGLMSAHRQVTKTTLQFQKMREELRIAHIRLDQDAASERRRSERIEESRRQFLDLLSGQNGRPRAERNRDPAAVPGGAGIQPAKLRGRGNSPSPALPDSSPAPKSPADQSLAIQK